MVLSTILAVEGSRSVRPHWGPRPPGGIGGFSGPLGPRTAGSSTANNNRNSTTGVSANPITATSSGPSAAQGGGGPATVGGATSIPSANMARRFEPSSGLPLPADIMGPCPTGPNVGAGGPFLRHPYPPSNIPWRRPGTVQAGRTDWRKYAWLCGACGVTMVALGIMYFVVYFVIRNQTSSMQYFETIPTYVPACLLTATGLLITCFMRKTNRTAIMTKLAGFSCMMCAVVCVVVTITTTVVHMNRLQTLRECVYTPQVRACACFSAVVDPNTSVGISTTAGGTSPSSNGPLAEAGKFVFGATESCDVVHGFLYTCLRIVFGVSVVAIILCIFSCMLTYQLVSHEKKKVYWEQLELRRRSFFSSRSHPSFLYCGCHDEYGFPSTDPYGWCSCSNTARLLESTSDMRTLTSPGDVGMAQPLAANGLHATERATADHRSRQGDQTEDSQEGNVSNGWRFLPWKRKRQQQHGGSGQRNGCSGAPNRWQSANGASASRQSQSDVGTGSMMTAADSMQLTEESSLGGPSVGNSSRSLRYSFLSNSSFDPGPRSRRGIVGSASFHVPPGLTLPANGRGHLLMPTGVIPHHDPLCQYPFLPSYHHHHPDPSHIANWGPPPPYSNPDSLGSGQSDSPSETSPVLGSSRHQVQGASGEDRQPQQPGRNNRRNRQKDQQQAKKPRPTSYPATASIRGLSYNNLPQPVPVHARSTRRTVLTPASSNNAAASQQGVRKYYGIDLNSTRRTGDHHRSNVSAERQQQQQSTSSLSSMASARAQNLSSSGELNSNRNDTSPGQLSFSTAQLSPGDLHHDPQQILYDEDPRACEDGANSPTLTATDAEVASFFADLPDVEQAHSSPKLHKSWPNVNASSGLRLPKSASCEKPGYQLETFVADGHLLDESVKYKAQRSSSLKTFSNGQQKFGVWRTTGRGIGSLPNSKSLRNTHYSIPDDYSRMALPMMKQPVINHQAILSCDNLPLVVPSQLSSQKDSATSFSHPAIPASMSHSPLRAPSQSFQFRSIHV